MRHNKLCRQAKTFGAGLRRGDNEMKKAYVKNKQGAWLVEGSIDGIKFHGHGRAYAFRQKDADLLCDSFGFTQQPVEGTEPVREDENGKM